MLRIQLFFSTIALFARIELLCSSVQRLPPDLANGVAVFEGSPVRYNMPRGGEGGHMTLKRSRIKVDAT